MADKENSPELFIDAPDKTAEALSTFVNIPECTYLAKHLGRSGQKETMTCDCPEQWDEDSASNLACGAAKTARTNGSKKGNIAM